MSQVPASRISGRTRDFWLAASLVGIVLRLILLPLSPRCGFINDHDDLARWSIQAVDKGVLTLYDGPPPRWNLVVWRPEGPTVLQRNFDSICAYPPATAYVLWACGVAFKAISPDRLINTPTSRTIFALPAIAADLLLAAGCTAIVSTYRPSRAARWAYLGVLLLPPFLWNTSVWGQIDSLPLAAATWMIVALIRHRWIAAGALLALTAMLKPQAVLFLPVWLLVVVLSRPIWKPLLALCIAALVAFLIALPFTLHSGLRWWQISYVTNILSGYPNTTLMAFNLWYPDVLTSGSDDALALWHGLSKDVWGKLLLGATLLGGFIWMLRRWCKDDRAILPWTVWTTLAAVMLPTRVHERYLLLVLPFLVAAAALHRRFVPGLILLLVVATAQVTWPVWLRAEPTAIASLGVNAKTEYQTWRDSMPPQQRDAALPLKDFVETLRADLQDRRAATVRYEWLFVGLALVAYVLTAGVILSLRPVPTASPESAASKTFYPTLGAA